MTTPHRSVNHCYSKSEVARAYNLNTRTLVIWMNNFGIETGLRRIIYPKELKLLREKIGECDLASI